MNALHQVLRVRKARARRQSPRLLNPERAIARDRPRSPVRATARDVRIDRVTHRGKTRNLVTQPLGRDDGDLIRDALVRREIKRETRVILLDDLARGLRDANAYARASVVAFSPARPIPRRSIPPPSNPIRVVQHASTIPTTSSSKVGFLKSRTFFTVFVRTRPCTSRSRVAPLGQSHRSLVTVSRVVARERSRARTIFARHTETASSASSVASRDAALCLHHIAAYGWRHVTHPPWV